MGSPGRLQFGLRWRGLGRLGRLSGLLLVYFEVFEVGRRGDRKGG